MLLAVCFRLELAVFLNRLIALVANSKRCRLIFSFGLNRKSETALW